MANEFVCRSGLIVESTVLTVSGTYQGDIKTMTVDDASTVFGNVLYQAADFNYERADANAAASGVVIALAVEAGSGSKKIMFMGEVCNTDWTWSAGLVFLSETVGEMTQTVVSGSGDQIVIVGHALSADTIWFNPQYGIAEV